MSEQQGYELSPKQAQCVKRQKRTKKADNKAKNRAVDHTMLERHDEQAMAAFYADPGFQNYLDDLQERRGPNHGAFDDPIHPSTLIAVKNLQEWRESMRPDT